MRKIRNKVFETNSSAVHCLVVSKELLQKSTLKIDNNGMINVGFITYDTTYPLSTDYEKLSYLITQLYYKSGVYLSGGLEDDYEFKIIQEYVCEYTGAKGIKIDYSNDPDINHQAIWCAGEDRFIDIFDKQSVLSFIFGPMMVKEYMD